MSGCGRLFRADQVYAYYDAAEKQVVILADVPANPVADDVHICPNPIAVPPAHEFLVCGTRRSGVHPPLVVVRRVSYSYSSDLAPKSVTVYTAGIDRPARLEVPVESAAPPPIEHAPPCTAEDASAPESASLEGAPQGLVEVTGYSAEFSLEEAVQDALAQAAEKIRVPPRNPDKAVVIDIRDIFARSGGNIRPGLFVRATAK